MRNTTVISSGSTTKWKGKLIDFFESKIKKELSSTQYYKTHTLSIENVGIHLAIFNEPFLSLLLQGKKIIESRFSINNVSPYLKVNSGDVVFMKKSGGAIYGYFIVNKTYYYNHLNSEGMQNIKKKFEKGICSYAAEHFWEDRALKKYISLLEVADLKIISPIKIDKKDRMAWAVIKSSYPNLLFK